MKIPRYIDADALIKKFENMGLGEHGLVERIFADGVYAVIENAPTIEAEPVVRSTWEYYWVDGFPSAPYHDIMRCPVCSCTHPKLMGYSYKRCMECGAIMDGGKKDGV